MPENKKFVIRCRAIILHEGKLLVVKHHNKHEFVALPGGHLEWGEDVRECVRREIIEELGIEPEIGRLLFVNTFQDGENIQPIEFFFEVTNGADYINSQNLDRTHAHEIENMFWVNPEDEVNLRPVEIARYFKEGKILSDEPRYIKDRRLSV